MDLSFIGLIKTKNKLCKLQRTILASGGCKILHGGELQADKAMLTRPLAEATPWAMSARRGERGGHGAALASHSGRAAGISLILKEGSKQAAGFGVFWCEFVVMLIIYSS